MKKTLPITIIIPLLNESDTILETVSDIANQTMEPSEVVVIDAGSNDGTIDILLNGWKKANTNANLIVEIVDGSYPGASRNLGIKLSSHEWVVFLDASIRMESDWLEKLWHCANKSDTKLIFGVCDFNSDSVIGKSVIAATYGVGTSVSSIPGSIFSIESFKNVGWFRNDLLSAEDLEWRHRYKKHYPMEDVCYSTTLHYYGPPENLMAIFKKWHGNARFLLRSKLPKKSYYLYMAIPFLFILSAAYSTKVLIWLFILYLLLRGLIDPIRRSNNNMWWDGENTALFMILPVVIVIDLAKFTGYIVEYSSKVIKYFK